MKIKEIFITTFIVLVVLGLYALNYIGNRFIIKADSIYEVYLNGKVLGYIEDDQKLYDLINVKQREIIEKYKVDNVYPPSNFQIVMTNSYDVELSSVNEIYNKLDKLEPFTILGTIITVTPPEDSDKKAFNIYALNREMFDEAVNNFILAFVSQDTYDSYMNQTQPKIETTGKVIEKMFFDEHIKIKQGYISVNENIFTNKEDLSKYLLFGENNETKEYVIQEGDTIPKVSEKNKLNTAEFLVANPEYSSEDSLLKIGDKVNVALINPMLTYVNEINEVKDVEVPYEKKVVYDDTKPSNYSNTTPGVTGLNRINQIYQVKNGEMQAGVFIASNVEIVPKVDEVLTRGGAEFIYGGSGSYVDTGLTWGWPTNTPYVITSNLGWRWGAMHTGIDISGTGYGSPIYSALDGTVEFVGWEGKCLNGSGNCVFINSNDEYFVMYAHLAFNSFAVSEGEKVKRGQIIAGMGSTGNSTGVHLHFEVWHGRPYASGSTLINPLTLYR